MLDCPVGGHSSCTVVDQCCLQCDYRMETVSTDR